MVQTQVTLGRIHTGHIPLLWGHFGPRDLHLNKLREESLAMLHTKGLGSIRGVFGPMPKISFTLSNYSFVIWDKNYRRYFVI